MPFNRVRVRAPELRAQGGWLNTGGRSLSLQQLRGKFVLLDFWTFACANCLHVIEELRPLERAYADVLVVVGVHSPKFAHEGEHDAVAAAIQRYGVRHPVLDDPELRLWQQYAVRAWPTLVLIDPEGYVVAQAAGEGQVSGLALILDELIPAYSLNRGDGPYVPAPARPGALNFPAKAVRLPAARTGRATDSLLVANAGAHDLVELDLDGVTVLRRFPLGPADPNGLALLPAGLTGYDVVVADTAHHLLRGLRLGDGAVTTVDLAAALDGARTITGAIPLVPSPWDVAWWPALDRVVVAAAGVHLLLSWDPRSGLVEILAGTTVEGLKDGPALEGWLAQPSGLAVDGDRVWFVDAETSALRSLSLDGQLTTWVGEGLFDFGHVDGPAATARLQHPLGVTLLEDGRLAVSDTYNGSIRGFDPGRGDVCTLATGLAEPSGALLVDGDLVVVESGAHRLVRAVAAPVLRTGPALRTQRPVTPLPVGPLTLTVEFTPPPGRTLDARHGPATRLSVSASPPSLLIEGAGDSTGLSRQLRLAAGEGVLHVSAQAAACDEVGEHPACHVSRQDWGVPVVVGETGEPELVLVLMG